jgi:hypothetical protein
MFARFAKPLSLSTPRVLPLIACGGMGEKKLSWLKKVVALLAVPLIQGCELAPPDEQDMWQQSAAIELPEPAFGHDGLDANAKMVRLNASVPGFGGLFLDEEGHPTILLKPGADHGQARTRLAPVFQGVLAHYPLQAAQASDIRILPGRFEFKELESWNKRLLHSLGSEGMSRLGIDVKNNRVVIGITAESARARVQEVVTRTHIPAEAVTIEVIEPMKPNRTLSDKWWPPPAGMRVQTNQQLSPGLWATCTLGYNIDHYQYWRSFITAAHCTMIQDRADNVQFFQPSAAWATFDYVGAEVFDPGPFTGGACPAGQRCRYSDAAIVRYEPNRTYGRLGQIAMPYQRCDTESSIYCDTTISNYFYNIANSTFVSALMVGQQVDKIGITTGQTVGVVTDTCWTFYYDGKLMLCQYGARLGSRGGDSGAPVFIHNANGYVQAVGLLWGGDYAYSSSFSLLSGVQADLGSFAIR